MFGFLRSLPNIFIIFVADYTIDSFMIVSNEIEKRVQGMNIDQVFSIADLGFPADCYDNVRIKLSRMAAQGLIVKAGKGRYYKPRQTVFGSLQPSREEIVKDLLVKDGKVSGYLTGYAIWNKMGLTTQIPNIIEIGSNIHRNKTKRGVYTIRFVLQPNNITRPNIPLLQILDAIKSVKFIPDTTIGESILRLSVIIGNLLEKDITRLATLALKYPPQTRAIIGGILETKGYDESAMKLHRTLNPMTIYKIGISEDVLPNHKYWNIV